MTLFRKGNAEGVRTITLPVACPSEGSQTVLPSLADQGALISGLPTTFSCHGLHNDVQQSPTTAEPVHQSQSFIYLFQPKLFYIFNLNSCTLIP